MTEPHPFLIEGTCFWHHEWEICGECGEGDKPDDPQKPFHLHHDEEVERQRQIHMPRQWYETKEECSSRRAGNWLKRNENAKTTTTVGKEPTG